MESQGADVVGFDLAADQSWDLAPLPGVDMTAFAAHMKNHIERLKNGWWFAHHACGSRARVVYGNIYAVPNEIGPIDISTFGSILLHLRDPFLALLNAERLTRETIIVTDLHPEYDQSSSTSSGVGAKLIERFLRRKVSSEDWRSLSMRFTPNAKSQDPISAATWWRFPPNLICQFLGVLGFERTTVTEHLQTRQGKKFRLFTVVGSRTRPFRERQGSSSDRRREVMNP